MTSFEVLPNWGFIHGMRSSAEFIRGSQEVYARKLGGVPKLMVGQVAVVPFPPTLPALPSAFFAQAEQKKFLEEKSQFEEEVLMG